MAGNKGISGEVVTMMTVMAQGVFDILHPGHLHYLEQSKSLGDELLVVIARDSRIEKDLYFSELERKEMLEALEIVDQALLGSEESIYDTVEKVDPDIITLGYDQPFDKEEVASMAREASNRKVEVKRIEKRSNYSSSDIRNH